MQPNTPMTRLSNTPKQAKKTKLMTNLLTLWDRPIPDFPSRAESKPSAPLDTTGRYENPLQGRRMPRFRKEVRVLGFGVSAVGLGQSRRGIRGFDSHTRVRLTWGFGENSTVDIVSCGRNPLQSFYLLVTLFGNQVALNNPT